MKSWNFGKVSWGWALLECFFAGPLCFFHYFKIPVALDRNCSAFFQYWEDGVVRLFGVIFHCFYSIFIFFSALHVLGCCSWTSFLELPCFLVRQSISVLLSESQSIDFKARHLKARSFSTSSLYLLHLIVSWFKFNLNLVYIYNKL